MGKIKAIRALFVLTLGLLVSVSFGQSTSEIDWLNAHLIPIKSVEPSADDSDLLPLQAPLGQARIVALGECTHGSKEVFQMKHRLLKYLVTQHGFRVFAIEAGMAEAHQLNGYLLKGQGDPLQLIQGMKFWMWSTQEVLETVRWMRAFNIAKKDSLRFTGIDMPFYRGSFDILQQFAQQQDLTLAQQLERVDSLAMPVSLPITTLSPQEWQDRFNQFVKAAYPEVVSIHAYLQTRRPTLLERNSPEMVDWIIQHANLLERYFEYRHPNRKKDLGYRDQLMAANVNWVLGQQSKQKIVLWAHNEHVAKNGPYRMGEYLRQKWGDEYLAVGFSTAEGTFAASTGRQAVENNLLLPPSKGSYEYYFQQAHTPNFILDLRIALTDAQAPNWLKKRAKMRSIGSMVVGGRQFGTSHLNQYDLLIYLHRTSSTQLIPFKEVDKS